MVGTDDWQIDIAIGTCAGNPVPPTTLAGLLGLENTSDLAPPPITFGPPVIIQIAIELTRIIHEAHGLAA
jgi:hypothetical protein